MPRSRLSALAIRYASPILSAPLCTAPPPATACAKTQIGATVTLAGWVNSRRDHGGVIFIDLRDREGLTQVVFRPEEHPQVAEASHGLRSEDVIQVTGIVAARLVGTENAKLATGDIEVIASRADRPEQSRGAALPAG